MAINLANPVNRQHPLNRGRVAWWKLLPGYLRSRTVVDLVNRYDGAITNGAEYSGLSPCSMMPGSLRCVTASSHYIDCGTVPLNSSNFSMAGWFYSATANSFTRMFSWAVFPSNGWSLWHSNAGAMGIVQAASILHNMNHTVTTGIWYHVAVARDGTSLRCFINGRLDSSSGSFSSSFSSSGPTYIGRGETGYLEYFNGYVDDVQLWDRTLNDEDVRQLYVESLTGYPSLLNRTRNVMAYQPAAAGLAANPLRGGGAAANPIWGYVA